MVGWRSLVGFMAVGLLGAAANLLANLLGHFLDYLSGNLVTHFFGYLDACLLGDFLGNIYRVLRM